MNKLWTGLYAVADLMIGVVHMVLRFCPYQAEDNHSTVGNEKALVLVHGSSAHLTQMLIPRRLLHQYAPNYRVYLVDLYQGKSYFPNCGDQIEDYAEVLINFLNNEVKEADVTVIGHSMGGLVAGLAAESKNLNRQLKQVMTIGTPWQGVDKLNFIAKYLNLPTRYLQMEQNSQLLRKLSQTLSNSRLTYRTFGSINDLQVTNAHINPQVLASNHTLVKGGHVSMIWSPTTWQKIAEYL